MTPAQKKCFDFVSGALAKDGVSPSYAEIASAIGYSSKHRVHDLVLALVEHGHLACVRSRSGDIRPRSLRLADESADRNIAYEQGYRQGFSDAMESAANQPNSPSDASSPSLRPYTGGADPASAPPLYSERAR